jgi:hypothetical protein
VQSETALASSLVFVLGSDRQRVWAEANAGKAAFATVVRASIDR